MLSSRNVEVDKIRDFYEFHEVLQLLGFREASEAWELLKISEIYGIVVCDRWFRRSHIAIDKRQFNYIFAVN